MSGLEKVIHDAHALYNAFLFPVISCRIAGELDYRGPADCTCTRLLHLLPVNLFCLRCVLSSVLTHLVSPVLVNFCNVTYPTLLFSFCCFISSPLECYKGFANFTDTGV